jgi:hypothetical protein
MGEAMIKAQHLVLVLVCTLAFSMPLAAQDYSAKDPLSGERFRILEPEDLPIVVHEVKTNAVGVWTMRWSNKGEKNAVAIEWKILTFGVCRSYYGNYHYDSFWVNSNRVKKSPGQYWHDFNFSIYSNPLQFYNYLIPERILFDDDTLWIRSDDAIYDQIVAKMGFPAPPGMEEAAYIALLKQLIMGK